VISGSAQASALSFGYIRIFRCLRFVSSIRGMQSWMNSEHWTRLHIIFFFQYMLCDLPLGFAQVCAL
jgi:hypothetical protein